MRVSGVKEETSVPTGKIEREKMMSLVNLLSKIEAGEIKPSIYKVLPMEKAEEAHDILYQGKNVGKVVLTVK